MAFRNKYGQAISYDCEDLIAELKQDIAEFGDKLMVEVITEIHDGVKLYKDYNFICDDKSTEFKLKETETTETMLAVELLKLYEQENSIF